MRNHVNRHFMSLLPVSVQNGTSRRSKWQKKLLFPQGKQNWRAGNSVWTNQKTLPEPHSVCSRHPKERCLTSCSATFPILTVKHGGGGVMVWDCPAASLQWKHRERLLCSRPEHQPAEELDVQSRNFRRRNRSVRTAQNQPKTKKDHSSEEPSKQLQNTGGFWENIQILLFCFLFHFWGNKLVVWSSVWASLFILFSHRTQVWLWNGFSVRSGRFWNLQVSVLSVLCCGCSVCCVELCSVCSAFCGCRAFKWGPLHPERRCGGGLCVCVRVCACVSVCASHSSSVDGGRRWGNLVSRRLEQSTTLASHRHLTGHTGLLLHSWLSRRSSAPETGRRHGLVGAPVPLKLHVKGLTWDVVLLLGCWKRKMETVKKVLTFESGRIKLEFVFRTVF